MSSPTTDPGGQAQRRVVVVATVALILTAPGQTLLLSLLNVPLRTAFGLDALVLNTGYMAATISASLPLVWVGTLTDRIGPRRMMIGVAAAFGAACLFMASAANVVMVFAGFFLLRFLGQGSLSLVSGHVLAMWFHRRLGRVEGLRNTVMFGAGAVLPTAVLALIERFGWRVTWAALGVIVAGVVSLLAWLWLHDRPEDLGLSLDGSPPATEGPDSPAAEPGIALRDAMATRAYVLLALAAAVPPMVATAVIFDIVPLFASEGMNTATAAAAVSVWSATMAVLAIPAGALIDRLPPGRLVGLGLVTLSGGCVLLLTAGTAVVAWGSMVLLGLGHSLVGPTVYATAARFFGRRHHGAIRSSLARIGVIATGLGPFAFGASQRLTGAYDAALVGFAVVCVPIAGLSLALAPPQASSRRGDQGRPAETGGG